MTNIRGSIDTKRLFDIIFVLLCLLRRANTLRNELEISLYMVQVSASFVIVVACVSNTYQYCQS